MANPLASVWLLIVLSSAVFAALVVVITADILQRRRGGYVPHSRRVIIAGAGLVVIAPQTLALTAWFSLSVGLGLMAAGVGLFFAG